MDMNFVIIVGRVANTPELKNFQKKDGSVGSRVYFPVAVTRLGDRGKREDKRTSFIDCVGWGDAAKNHAQHLTKGTEVAIMGELVVENLTDAEGNFVRKTTSIMLRDVQYGRRPSKNAAPAGNDAARIQALEEQIRKIVAGGAAPATPATAPAVETAAGEDPFEG